MLKPLGLFATTRSEKIKAVENKPGRQPKISVTHASLNPILILEFIMISELEFGKAIIEKEKNQSLINNYAMALRQQNVLYNIHALVSNLRLIFQQITTRMLFKKKCLINYNATENAPNALIQRKELNSYLRREFMVTWKKWLGGVLTNFKRISKRLISRLKNKAYDNNMKEYTVTYPRNLPTLPSFMINTWDCHWALNESRSLRIKNVQMVENSYMGLNGDINLAMNTSYYALCSFTVLLQECSSSIRQSTKFIHRGKLIRRLRRKSRKFNLAKFLRTFNENKY